MPNEMKYGKVEWPSDSPIAGERMATAGEYTGQHKGTPAQDALADVDNEAYLRARETIRYGTLTPDAADNHFPDILVEVAYTATGAVTDISLAGVTYDTTGKVFSGVPSKAVSFTFKDGSTSKTATNSSGTWTIA